eukprot:2775030-Rhodomonas_salina.2
MQIYSWKGRERKDKDLLNEGDQRSRRHICAINIGLRDETFIRKREGGVSVSCHPRPHMSLSAEHVIRNPCDPKMDPVTASCRQQSHRSGMLT